MAETHDVVATTRLHAVGLVLSAAVGVVIVVVSATEGGGLFAVFGLAIAAYIVFDISRTVWRVTVSDGLLELRYLHRRRIVPLADIERVKCIPRRAGGEGGSSPPMFAFHPSVGSSFRIVANDDTRALVDSIRRRRPGLTVEGSIW